MAESNEELKSLLVKVKEESEKAGLKLNIQKTKIMASGPITSWQIDGEKIATMTDFIFLGSKITANSDCRHKIKRCLLLGRKAIDKPKQHTKKQRRCFADRGPYSQRRGFSVVMYRCESWTIKKAESQRTDAFELWFWRRLLKVPWTAGISNKSILKEINPEYSLEGLMLKLKLQYFGYLMRRADLFGKDPDTWKGLRQEEKGMTEDEMVGWHHRCNGLEFEKTLGDGEGQGTWPAAVHGVAKSWTWLSDWTATITTVSMDWNIKHVNDVRSHPNWSVSLTLSSKRFVPIDKFILKFVQMSTSPRIAK